MKPLLTLHDPVQARAYHRAGLWSDDGFYALLAAHAAARPDAFAARDGVRRVSWQQLQAWVDVVAARLHRAGVDRGERVSLWASNRLEVVVAFLACCRNGYVCNPSLHQNYTGQEVLGLLDRIGTTALLVEAGYGAAGAGAVLAAAAALPQMRQVLTLPTARETGDGFPPLPDIADDADGDLPPPVAGADKVCYLAFTSGTTGQPKGVMHSDNTLLANARDLVRDWGHDGDTVLLSLSPLSHHIAWVALAQALVAGAEFVVNDPPDGATALDWIVASGATYVMGVPTHAMDIQAEQRQRGLARLGAVRVFYMAGSPIPPAVAEAFVAQGITPQNVYGMTENSSHQYTHPDDDAARITATCGRGGRAYEVRIFDRENADRALPPGSIGQIGGRGAALMLGYFDNQAATEQSFNRDGWFLSGDLGVLDDAGHLAIVGRLKDMIIRGGHNIHPARIEDLAVKHAGVAKAAVFPVADERLGEKVCLAVLADDATPPAAGALLDHLHAAGLSIYDMPEYFIVLDDLPLTASGKILKRELAAWVRDGRLRPQPVRFVAPEKR